MFLLDINISMCFMSFFVNFEGVLLVMRGCACVLRGTLKTPNSPPLRDRLSLIIAHVFFGSSELLS